MRLQIFMIKNINNTNNICLAEILVDFILKRDEKYYR